jgi:hypothetical protein
MESFKEEKKINKFKRSQNSLKERGSRRLLHAPGGSRD